MFEQVYDRWKSEARGALRLSALAAACGSAAAIALGFVCAAVFVFVLDRYGLVDACLVGAAIFLFAMLVLLAGYAALSVRRRREERERATADARSSSVLADPRLLLLGLQIVQAVGVKRLLPILALGAAAFALGSGVMRTRAEAPDHDPPPRARSRRPAPGSGG
jgi:hypothetical protein